MAIKRELVQLTPGATRFVRRDDNGQFAECVAVWSSLSRDGPKRAKMVAKPGRRDKRDRPRTKR